MLSMQKFKSRVFLVNLYSNDFLFQTRTNKRFCLTFIVKLNQILIRFFIYINFIIVNENRVMINNRMKYLIKNACVKFACVFCNYIKHFLYTNTSANEYENLF